MVSGAPATPGPGLSSIPDLVALPEPAVTTPAVSKTLFEKIIDRELPATIVYEDELCLAFKDIHPCAPMHVLLVPKKPILQLSHAASEDQALLGHLMLTATKVAALEGLGEAYRLVINNGAAAGMSVSHLHLHLIGGRPLKWPPA
ncbi:MAG: histidine triad nucleotide-binding protein [Nevskiaceae bacterium]|nr:MAG: histidine triad nucleotide-binding protein [Nevskiaceae bacterium]TAM21720.1 MAG: histidine triad nucleotide-binding protein [Nevskiaceae bacterium]